MLLKDLQDAFQHYLMRSDITPMLSQVMPDERFSAENRLKVYHDAYRIRLLEILQIDYPKTHTLMGDQDFELAFLKYLEQYPSHHFSVRYFGQHFKDFLAKNKPFSQFPVFAEMAKFEWLIAYTFDSLDGPTIQKDALMAFPPEQWPDLGFTLHPSVTSGYFEWDTPQLWQAIEAGESERAPVKQPQAIRWLFWRKGLKTYFQSCNLAEDAMFEALQQGHLFGEICESLLDILPEEEIPQVAAQTLFKWVTEGMISSLHEPV